jgi:hypothetical protein
VQENIPVGANLADEVSSRRWFLARGLEDNVLWIHTRGVCTSEGDPIQYMSVEMLLYLSLQCHVYSRDDREEDPLLPEWVKQENLQGRSLFIGINKPLLLKTPEASTSQLAEAGSVLPLFKRDYVFTTHKGCLDRPQQVPDWASMPVNGGPAIGSMLTYEGHEFLDQLIQPPMWFVPSLPEHAPWW